MKPIVLFIFFFAAAYGYGQQLVYTPKNPAFGGDPFKYTWLLNSANAQNSFEDPNSQFGELPDFSNFDDLLNQQQLNGDNLPEVGTSTDGNLEYEVFESSAGLVINILDITTGEQSQIIIPN
jgi:curli production assembly/transport component CsgF